MTGLGTGTNTAFLKAVGKNFPHRRFFSGGSSVNSSLYIGATGMKGLAQGMQVTTNNLANVSTIGYKHQSILFSDILYQSQAGIGNWWNAQEDSRVAIGQVGMGLQVESVRTIFQQGGLESSNTVTDMAINGKGFFQVMDEKDGGVYYTRAGDFRPDNEGVWRTPTGLALMGYQIGTDGSRGGLAPVQVDTFATIPAKTTSAVELTLNLSSRADKSASAENPYFALLDQYDGRSSTPLSTDAYTYSQPMTVYDAEGNARTVTAYFDGAPSDSPNRYMEFILAAEPTPRYDEEGNAIAPEPGDGLLMSGVLQFDSAGNLQSVSAFTPATEGSKELEDWVPAQLAGGLPQFTLDGAPMTLDLGIRAAGGWENAPASAAEVGTDMHLLPSMGEGAVTSQYPTTAFTSSTPTSTYTQDGYAEGFLSTVSIRNDGTVVGHFSNSESLDLWQIPICRFTSEDGLRREGSNLFSATPDAGQMEMGVAGTENYGTVQAYNIELSNVDMATEMVNMIITQRGFQSNSKVVTTADQMLQKAMELKRS